ncbi:hypothetical protein EDEG_02303 [Edhazardia aedis USNM 41457]|uniref:Uncharacterized protein n=1 Tax=Edhazardia aedis (strain USNM 41457) TaxID=1003232 RepID=J9D6C1_EDHAE|nr:hypothetical protein EDEG_02303 [Edhazardia aedis USNM 41457]|eukprot:EJW03346.1 hypothetical protein EDEG_02303 [Edhazardia aedis USNM 41457]
MPYLIIFLYCGRIFCWSSLMIVSGSIRWFFIFLHKILKSIQRNRINTKQTWLGEPLFCLFRFFMFFSMSGYICDDKKNILMREQLFGLLQNHLSFNNVSIRT